MRGKSCGRFVPQIGGACPARLSFQVVKGGVAADVHFLKQFLLRSGAGEVEGQQIITKVKASLVNGGQRSGDHQPLEVLAVKKGKRGNGGNTVGNHKCSLLRAGAGVHHCAVLCHQYTIHRLIGRIALRHINGAKLSTAAEGVLLDYRHICRDRDLRQALTVNERLKADRLHTFGQCKVLQLITPHKGPSSDYLHVFGEYDRLQLCTFLEHAHFDDFQISRQLDKLQIGALGENTRTHCCHSVGEFHADQTGFLKSHVLNFRQASREFHAL